MSEQKIFEIPASAKENAWIDNDTYLKMYQESVENPEGFWDKHADRLDWFKKWNRTLNPEQGLCNIYYSGITNTDVKIEGGTRYILVVYLRYTDDIYLNSVEQIFNDGKKQFGLHNKQQVWNVVKNQL